MNRVIVLILLFITTSWAIICKAQGTRYTDDKDYSNIVIAQGAFKESVFTKNVTITNAVIRKEAFKEAIVIGDLTIQECIVATDALDGITVVGQQIIDENTTYFIDEPSSNHSGATFGNDVTVTDAVIGNEAYKDAVFFGDLTVNSILIEDNAFSGATICGDLIVNSFRIGNNAFGNSLLLGVLKINEPCTIIGNSAFDGLKSKEAVNLRLPASVARIGFRAFRNANANAVDIANCRKLRMIGDQAFYGFRFHQLIIPQTEKPLTIGKVAFGDRTYSSTNDQTRKVFMPQHVKGILNYGIPVLDDAYEEDTLFYGEDIISLRDSVFLWLDPDQINNLRITYGTGANYLITEYSSYVAVESIHYESSDKKDSYMGTGILFVPRGCKQKLIDILHPIEYKLYYNVRPVPPLYYFPVYSYFKEENIIEIEMGEYPNYSMDITGDLNGDKDVDSSDVSILLEIVLAGGITDEQKAKADINGDGGIDSSDIAIVLAKILSTK